MIYTPSNAESESHYCAQLLISSTNMAKRFQSQNLNKDSPLRYTRDCDFFIDVRPLYLRVSWRRCPTCHKVYTIR